MLVIIAIIVVVVVVVLVAGLWASGVFNSKSSPSGGSGAPPATVDITAVNWDNTGSSCTGDASQSTSAGEVVDAGATITATETLVNGGIIESCTFADPGVTPGFTITSSNAPITVIPGGTQTLQMEIVVPSYAWTGVLTVSLSVTTAY